MTKLDLHPRQDAIAEKIAWHLPRRVIYWATLRAIAHATTGQFGNTDPSLLPAMEMLERWNQEHEARL